MDEFNNQVEQEIETIHDILKECGVSDKKRQLLSSVIENTAWMKVKLDSTRETVKTSSVVIKYDNGGGQTGIRENPIFKGYETLFKSYMQGFERIFSCVPEEKAEIVETVEKPKTILELVKDRHEKETKEA